MNNENDHSKPKSNQLLTTKQFDSIVQYNVSFDFSNLSNILKENYKCIHDNEEELKELKKAICGINEFNETMRSRLEEIYEEQSKTNVLVTYKIGNAQS